MKIVNSLMSLAVCLGFTASAFSASIVWVSEMYPTGTATSDKTSATEGVFGAGTGPYPDQGMVNLLTAAGHTVTRFNPADTVALTAGNISQLNTHDLIIIGRSIPSGNFGGALATPWNTQVTKPVMSINPYALRPAQLGWFTAGNIVDSISNPLTFANPSSPASAYIIGSTAMNGSTMVSSFTEAVVFPDSAVDIRGTSVSTDAAVAGANVIATAPAGTGTGNFIVEFQAGTTVVPGVGNQQLAGYRLAFAATNRESASAPNNTVGSAGFENLTPAGEAMFLRAVNLAINGGVIPEPGTVALLFLASSAALRRRRTA